MAYASVFNGIRERLYGIRERLEWHMRASLMAYASVFHGTRERLQWHTRASLMALASVFNGIR